jgi:hypothetical protein
MRGAFFFTLSVAVALWLSAGRAYAVTEYCPAMLEEMKAFAASPGTEQSAQYLFELSAFQPRSAAATVTVESSEGWYTFYIPRTPLVRRTVVINPFGGSITSSGTIYASDQGVVQFPQPVHVVHAWISQAQGFDDGNGWSSRGVVPCAAGKVLGDPDLNKRALYSSVDPQIKAPLVASVVQATPIAAPVLGECKTSFVATAVERPVNPEFPEPARAGIDGQVATLIYVAVNSDGKLDDAWTFTSTGPGLRLLDDAALAAARRSSYKPAQVLCKNVPGLYIFRAEFSPN